MNDLIDRQTVINRIANTCFWLSAGDWIELMDCINSISPISSKQIDAEVLDKISAEIANIYCGEYCEKFSADAVREMALEIIDKYKAESEE